MNNKNSICYVGGAGRLGICLASHSADRGFNVLVADVNETSVQMINDAVWPISEMELGAAKMQAAVNMGRLVATCETAEAARVSELIFIVVPTPSQDEGAFSIIYVINACIHVGQGLRNSQIDYPIVVIVSTVNPGDTRGPIKKVLEENSGKKAGQDFGLIYSPEFIRQGSIIRDFAEPDLVLVGTYGSAQLSTAIEYYYKKITRNDVPVHWMSLESAEIAKIGLNAALSTKIALANQLMWLCHDTPRADAFEVLSAVGGDHRIGRDFFSAGLWAAGPCLPRDNRALSAASLRLGHHRTHILADATDAMAGYSLERLRELVLGFEGRVGILGLAYKTGVDIYEDSPGKALAFDLFFGIGAYQRDVLTFDFSGRATKGNTFVESLEAIVKFSDVLVFALPDRRYRQVAEMDLTGKVIIDCWGLFKSVGPGECEKYILLGKGETNE